MKLNRLGGLILIGIGAMQLPMVASGASYWTWWASEETPPAACNIGDAVEGASCRGGNCDDTALLCKDTNYRVLNRYWTSNFSEEGSRNYRFCGIQEIMTGISCSGSRCDNVSIECSKIPNFVDDRSCRWLGPYSEEQGARYFNGQVASGMLCRGSNCDNHYYWVCTVR